MRSKENQKFSIIQSIKNISCKIREKLHSFTGLTRINILAIFVGIIGGLGSLLFKWMTELVFDIFIKLPQEFLTNIGLENYRWLPFLISPIIGSIFVGVLVSRVSRETKGHGIPEIINTFSNKGGKMDIKVPVIKIVASAFTIGTGGSAGREGPIAQIGAGFGSNLGQYLKLNERETKVLVLAGVSAGISAIFNAPIGGVLFSVEIIKRKSSMKLLSPLIIASVVGTVMGQFLFGSSPALQGFPEISYNNTRFLLLFLILGAIIGIISALWIKFFYGFEDRIEALFKKLRISEILQPAIGAIGIGLILAISYQLNPETWENMTIMGFSYLPMNSIFDGSLLNGPIISVISVLFVIVLLKIIATSLSIGTGGSGGIFAPILFFGTFFGAIFGVSLSSLFGLSNNDIEIFALLGMASFFAGCARAPFTAIFMTAEMTGNYFFTIPLMFAVIMSIIVSSKIEPEDVYLKKLSRRGLVLTSNFANIMDTISVRDAMIPAKNLIKIKPEFSVDYVIELMYQTKHFGMPILKEDRLIGVVTIKDLEKEGHIINHTESISEFLKTNKEIAAIAIKPEATLSQAISVMVYYNISRLPVVEENNEKEIFIGWLANRDLKEAYFLKNKSHAHPEIENNTIIIKNNDI